MHDDGPPPPLYLNRELSWLAFNARVLHEAADSRVPLLERLKFLAIFGSNLDEFFMVRVAGLRRQIASGTLHHTPDGLTAADQLAAIRARVALLLEDQRRCLGALLDELAPHGVRLVGMDSLTAGERRAIDEQFESQIFPVLTPLAVDPGHPFPYVSNLSLSLAVEVRDPAEGSVHFARVKVPERLSRWVAVPGRTHEFVPLEQVIGENLEALFSGMDVLGWYAFRVTRYSDLEFTNLEDPDDLLASIEERVFERRFGEVIRLEVQDDTPAHLRALLLEELRDADFPAKTSLSDADVEEAGHLLDLSDLLELASLDIAELRDPPFTPSVPPELRDPDRSIFEVIRERDLLVHHPFDSFPATVERFLQSAAMDEQVLAIKLTLYRTSGDTAIVRALTEAAQRGKQVAVLVELRARFDEANNITWARTLEDYGVHVAYGSALLKTHTKTAMVVRREPDGIRRYIHIGSGNYNSRTARLYTDVGLFTCSPSIGADVSDLFNSLTGISRQRLYRKLLVAPANMRERFIELIRRESAHAMAGRGGRIVAKMNALVDAETIDALYAASEAGVEIDLIVRGICCLRPGLPGVSSRIRVISVIGRFLEHSRVWQFGNAGDDELYIGSADWMPRNFVRRVEAVAPVEAPRLRDRLRRLLQTYLDDNRQAWELDSNGRYAQRTPGDDVRASQLRLLADSWGEREGTHGRTDGLAV
ncbi:MAG TPA: polyphosphate kinase 1 [Gemmatimonadaceae bacterium]|nr:polyphosphate kinase 1 [Gemmatimonadaceae bacterium]